ncbi:hypothetical protein AUEXF2481DRAFT_33244 [Aureobasidium subglaciale EXF-2481]|uniref:Uncharacterized protein n=1 Tax=Aureobasidium subglaciale (strain EXF-2481) TaxID=1043005 RepID=A0A074Y0H2_AURSE|nr:uncharacterized protein AUEXF2481DRAFT_33244 [Aureobasidium subglaciale EXF-2481]KAI5198545.1 hypothetical protein E4T38_07432 [Aureobasidium subglaciale]KAI5217356.1 hypothetical protein E4T40_07443 [Aureobasidium subglaciale]KAI5220962.1 hypothetical protein E4T41_07284 [Aureobasidium subglaciale]KAI5258470.1 hypothetical protein E4T46_07261 [Aureobasidium subglaciale]KEQ91293.1 hypothetical protein AUEXF2481DRAFT_33244 [Aureobasidium subglaciale EXF-2481]
MTASGIESLEQDFDDGYNAEQYFDGADDEELPDGYNNDANDEELPDYSSATLNEEEAEPPYNPSNQDMYGALAQARLVNMRTPDQITAQTEKLEDIKARLKAFTVDQLDRLYLETTSKEFCGLIKLACHEKRMAELDAFEAEVWVMSGR